jgi:hypothetical protein
MFNKLKDKGSVCISNADPDPGAPNQCGSGSRSTKSMRIRNTGKFEAQPDLVLLKKELQILCTSTTVLSSQEGLNGTKKVMINKGSAIDF